MKTKARWGFWDWSKPANHSQQPRLDWYVEQAAGLILMRLAIRAHRRRDRQTFDRLYAAVKAGAAAERSWS